MSWNDERVESLKKLWAEGLSASQIASRIGGVTRNAVIGKVHRLGLSGRATASRSAQARPRPRISAPRRPAKPRFAQINGMAADADFKSESAKLAVNRWILTELSRATTEITAAITSYRFNDAATLSLVDPGAGGWTHG